MNFQVQPSEKVPARDEQAQRDILHFKAAVDSYTARAAKNPGLTFRRHLASILETARREPPNRQ